MMCVIMLVINHKNLRDTIGRMRGGAMRACLRRQKSENTLFNRLWLTKLPIHSKPFNKIKNNKFNFLTFSLFF